MDQFHGGMDIRIGIHASTARRFGKESFSILV
jgi:hypothetical protein